MLNSLKNCVRELLTHSYFLQGNLNILNNKFCRQLKRLREMSFSSSFFWKQDKNSSLNAARVLLKAKLSSVNSLQYMIWNSQVLTDTSHFYSCQTYTPSYFFKVNSYDSFFGAFFKIFSRSIQTSINESLRTEIQLQFPTTLSFISINLCRSELHFSYELSYQFKTKEISSKHFLRIFTGFTSLLALLFPSTFLMILSKTS